MKTFKHSIIYTIILFSLFLVGCVKSTMDYEGEDGVYFAVQYGAEWGDTTKWPYHPLSEIKFINAESDDSTHVLRVALNGRVKDYDRVFRLSVDKDSTTAIEGVNYDAISQEFTLKANTTYTDIPIVFHKTDNILKEQKVLFLRLVGTDDLKLSMPIWDDMPDLWPGSWNHFDNTCHKIILSNFYIRPAAWMGMPVDNASDGEKEAGFLGQFTPKKFLLICELMNGTYGWDLKYTDFSDKTIMPNPRISVIKDAMVKYLTEQFNAGTPVLEDDGRLMWVMGVKWSSFIGKPYNQSN